MIEPRADSLYVRAHLQVVEMLPLPGRDMGMSGIVRLFFTPLYYALSVVDWDTWWILEV